MNTEKRPALARPHGAPEGEGGTSAGPAGGTTGWLAAAILVSVVLVIFVGLAITA
ncbi:hypothetical protein J2S41_004641 [Catenuloplanes atrovinosus]|uniref:Uncharacterized protein n=1 Tax=Catenuloplanes atrovinosus TaxID=137266 RepID=A0AAE3YSZ3_9ACTN|nr:hypothetical protein [Catenuloplanes atrovinosus]